VKGNDFVVWLLRTPLRVFMGNTALITVIGRKTGRTITLPVSYDREGNTLWILTARNRTWWRNLAHGGYVTLRLRGRDVQGYGELLREERAVAAQIGQYVLHLPLSARWLGLRVNNGVVSCEDSARLAKDQLLVRVRISDSRLD
jgi:hypothetical protein